MADTKAKTNTKAQTTAAGLHNPANVKWPTDRWGAFKELRAAFIKAAGHVKGDPVKYALFEETAKLGFAHVKAKQANLVEVREKRKAYAVAAEEAAKEAKVKAIEIGKQNAAHTGSK